MSGALPLKQLQYDLGRRICQVVGYHGLGAGAGFGRQVIITIPCMHDVSPTAAVLPKVFPSLLVGGKMIIHSQPPGRTGYQTCHQRHHSTGTKALQVSG